MVNFFKRVKRKVKPFFSEADKKELDRHVQDTVVSDFDMRVYGHNVSLTCA